MKYQEYCPKCDRVTQLCQARETEEQNRNSAPRYGVHRA